MSQLFQGRAEVVVPFHHGEIIPLFGQVDDRGDLLSDSNILCVRVLGKIKVNIIREICYDIFAVPTTTWGKSIPQENALLSARISLIEMVFGDRRHEVDAATERYPFAWEATTMPLRPAFLVPLNISCTPRSAMALV